MSLKLVLHDGQTEREYKVLNTQNFVHMSFKKLYDMHIAHSLEHGEPCNEVA